MDEVTKEIVLKYVYTNYNLTYESFLNYTARDIHKNVDVSIGRVYEDIMDMFGFNNSETAKYFSAWVDAESIRIDNEHVDKMYMSYNDGIPLNMSERVSVWAGMGKIATLKAIHETNVKKGNI